MNIYFFGTSAGSPSRERNVSGLGLRQEQRSDWYLFDCGEGTQHQIMRSSYSLAKLSKIFISHLHGDHWYGLPGLINSRGLMKAESKLTIYGPVGLKQIISDILAISGSNIKYPMEIIEFDGSQELYSEADSVRTVALMHDLPSVAFIVQQSDHPGSFDKEKAVSDGIPEGPLFGKLKAGMNLDFNGKLYKSTDYIGESQKGLCLIVAGDNAKPELLKAELESCDCLIHEATHTESTKARLNFESMHSTAASIAATAAETSLKNLVLTHFSARFSKAESDCSIKLIEDEARQFYSGCLILAEDHHEYFLNRDVELTILNDDNNN